MKKLNYQFLFLQTIGIILVVCGHSGGISFFTDWFPAYSFHMPLFIFISGYFYSKRNELVVKDYLVKKVKNLIIPYFMWNLFYGIVLTILLSTHLVHFGSKLSLETFFIDPWKHGHQYAFNLAAWFVLALFLVQIINVILRKILILLRINNEYLITVVFLIIGCIGVHLSINGINSGWYLPMVRTMFLIPFFQIGYLYKTKLEKYDKINNCLYFLLLFIIQFLLKKQYVNLTFTAAWMNDLNQSNLLLPYITSITGIMFWLRISKIVEPIVKNSKVILYIGSNTWTVMMHHLFIFYLFNVFILSISQLVGLDGFSVEGMKSSISYFYYPTEWYFTIFYAIAGLSVPLLIKYFFTKYFKMNFTLNNLNVRKQKAVRTRLNS